MLQIFRKDLITQSHPSPQVIQSFIFQTLHIPAYHFLATHKQASHNVLAEVFVGYSIIDCTPRIRFPVTTALVFNYIFTLATFQFITKLFRTLIFMVKIGIAIRISLRVRPNFDLPSPSPKKESENLSKRRHVP